MGLVAPAWVTSANDIGVPWPPCARPSPTLIVARLREAGVRALFGVPGGGGNLDLIDAAARARPAVRADVDRNRRRDCRAGAGGSDRPAGRVPDDARSGRGVGRERRRVRVSRSRADHRVHRQQSGRRERDVCSISNSISARCSRRSPSGPERLTAIDAAKRIDRAMAAAGGPAARAGAPRLPGDDCRQTSAVARRAELEFAGGDLSTDTARSV